jgi:hypothetical protein
LRADCWLLQLVSATRRLRADIRLVYLNVFAHANQSRPGCVPSNFKYGDLRHLSVKASVLA